MAAGTHAFLAIWPCGHANAASVDRGDQNENKQVLHEWIDEGAVQIELVPVDQARQRIEFCECSQTSKGDPTE